ncbi:MAG: hypothetical protein QM597_08550 [Aeromicrobium sp.]|uniref:DUF6941 family protein n=1 Tax=Aeromicrobium sp. TaxID=1871063 RepID=UPI0039E6E557
MKAHLLLADHAQQESGGKVHALGLGWTTTRTPTPPQAVVVLLRVPWNETNTRHRLTLSLVDTDGRPVIVGQGPQGRPQPLQIQHEFEVGRPVGVPAGFEIEYSLTTQLGPGMPLEAGKVYEWRLDINGVHEDTWRTTFFVRPS